MKRKRHTPEEIMLQSREGDPICNEGTDVTEMLCASASTAALPMHAPNPTRRRRRTRGFRS